MTPATAEPLEHYAFERVRYCSSEYSTDYEMTPAAQSLPEMQQNPQPELQITAIFKIIRKARPIKDPARTD